MFFSGGFHIGGNGCWGSVFVVGDEVTSSVLSVYFCDEWGGVG